MPVTVRVGQGFDVHPFSDDPQRRLVLGGVVFDWVDRWYMDGFPSEHDPGTRYWAFSPDHLDHEEWFGMVSMGDGSDTLMRQKRKAYDYLADVWNRPELSFDGG